MNDVIETKLATHRTRIRCGSWRTFERRFQPMSAPSHDVLWDLHQLPENVEPHHWWTVLDCDGRLYVSPGFRFVNRFAYIRPDYPDRSVAFGRTAAIVLRGCGEIVTATPARRARFFGSSKRRL